MPSIAVDCGFVIGAMGAVENSQMQGICARAIVSVGIVVGVFPCGGVFVAMPEITLAGGLRIYVVCTVIDSQV